MVGLCSYNSNIPGIFNTCPKYCNDLFPSSKLLKNNENCVIRGIYTLSIIFHCIYLGNFQTTLHLVMFTFRRRVWSEERASKIEKLINFIYNNMVFSMACVAYYWICDNLRKINALKADTILKYNVTTSKFLWTFNWTCTLHIINKSNSTF